MNLIGRSIALLLGMSLLTAIGMGLWITFQTIVALLEALDPPLATATGIVSLSVLGAAWWVARSVRAAVRQGKTMALSEEKTAAYQLFVDYWKARLQEPARADLSQKLELLDRLLALYGSAAVIRAHSEMRGVQHAELRARFGEALVAMRKDLGADTPGGAARELERLIFDRPAGAMP